MSEFNYILSNEKSLTKKIIFCIKEGVDYDFLIALAKEDEDEYIDDLIEQDPDLFIEKLIYNNDIHSKLLKRRLGPNLSLILKKTLTYQLFRDLSEFDKNNVLLSLKDKNQLKGSNSFLRNKIEENILFVKLQNGILVSSIGLKNIDQKIIDKIGEEYSDFKEVGWAQNNGDMSDYRSDLLELINMFNFSLISLIRVDNPAAIRLTKRFGFKEESRIKSPYSENLLVVLTLRR